MAGKEYGPCTTVGKGGVGESGASSIVVHQVSTGRAMNIVLRSGPSSLCPNTGAVAVITVNGIPVAMGDITNAGSQLTAEAPNGAWVTVIVHTVPLFNEIVCIRLGELEFSVDECDFVG